MVLSVCQYSHGLARSIKSSAILGVTPTVPGHWHNDWSEPQNIFHCGKATYICFALSKTTIVLQRSPWAWIQKSFTMLAVNRVVDRMTGQGWSFSYGKDTCWLPRAFYFSSLSHVSKCLYPTISLYPMNSSRVSYYHWDPTEFWTTYMRSYTSLKIWVYWVLFFSPSSCRKSFERQERQEERDG